MENIHKKLATVQQALAKDTKMVKNDKVSYSNKNFNYFSYDFLVKKIVPLAVESGLTFFFNIVSNDEPVIKTEKYLNKFKEEKTRTEIFFKVQLILINAENPEQKIIIESPACGSDDNSKSQAIGSGTTYAKRYLMHSLFLCGEVDSTEKEVLAANSKSKAPIQTVKNQFKAPVQPVKPAPKKAQYPVQKEDAHNSTPPEEEDNGDINWG